MNWSTRLRRWVRIRTPPVRVASMKPTAATVLPAPVACSNQKRRAAPGSSGGLLDDLVFVLGAGFRPSPAAPRPRAPRLRRALRLPRRLRRRRRRRSRLRRCRARRRRLRRRPARPRLGGADLLPGPSARRGCRRARRPDAGRARRRRAGSAARPRGSAPARAAASSCGATRSRAPRRRPRSRLSAASSACRRAVPGASASGPSPSSRKGSRANDDARSISALDGTAAPAATSVVLAIEGFGVCPGRNWRGRPQARMERGLREVGCSVPPRTQEVREPRTERLRIVITERMRRRITLALALLAGLALTVTGGGCGSSSGATTTHPDYKKALKGAPAPLAKLYGEANQLLPGGKDAFEKRVASLGYPVVANVWASLVRPLPLRVPDVPGSLGEVGQEGRLHRDRLRRLRKGSRKVARRRPGPIPELLRPATSKSPRSLQGAGPARHRLLRPRAGSSST